MNKKFLLGLMLAMFVFVLAACGNSSEESTESEEEASGDEAVETTEDASEDEASGDKTTVTLACNERTASGSNH